MELQRGHRGLQGVFRGYRGPKEVTRGFNVFQRVTTGLKRVKEGYKALQDITGVKKGYTGL